MPPEVELTRWQQPDGGDVYSVGFDTIPGGLRMSKGMDRKKETKKKPAKSFEEKRAAKREKRQTRGR
jgi:hypothetical protein